MPETKISGMTSPVHTLHRCIHRSRLPSSALLALVLFLALLRSFSKYRAMLMAFNATYFPDLQLSVSSGFHGSSLASLIRAPNLLWSLGTSLTEAILDDGQCKLATSQARGVAKQMTGRYRQTMPTAPQKLEDSLVLAERLQREAQLQGKALQATQCKAEISLNQYRAGTVGFLNVILAQTLALDSESTLLAVRNRQPAAINQLSKGIVGRWEKVS